MTKLKFPLLILLLICLTACSERRTIVDLRLHYLTAHSVPGPTVHQRAQQQMTHSAVAVDQSLAQLSAMQMAIHPDVALPARLNPNRIGMAQRVSLDWAGPVEPALRKIAKIADYKVRVLGNRPAIAVIIHINQQNVLLYDLLRDATYQVAQKATITIYPSLKIIELRYRPL